MADERGSEPAREEARVDEEVRAAYRQPSALDEPARERLLSRLDSARGASPARGVRGWFAVREFRARPAAVFTTLVVVLVGGALPYSPVAAPLGLAPLPGSYFLFVALVVGTYLVFIEIVKHKVMGKLIAGAEANVG